MSDMPLTQHTCLNCGTNYVGNYCPSCGQKHGPPMPTTQEIVGDFLRSALSPSGKLVETLWTLLRHPGELTRAFNSGQRVRFVHPVRVYLLCVFALVAAMTVNDYVRAWMQQTSFAVASSVLFAQKADAQPDATPDAAVTGAKASSAAHDAGRALGGMLPSWLRDRLKARRANKPDVDKAQFQQKANAAVTKHFSALFAALVPFMALVNWGLYAGRGITYAGHFVFLLHATAASCLFLLPAYVFNQPWAYFPLTIAGMAWAILAARRAFSVSLWGSAWRYVVYLIPSLLISALAGAVVTVATVFFGS